MFFLFIGITDDGFEMLEQLAYLYLANNKVSHGRLFSQLTRTLIGMIFLLYCDSASPRCVCALIRVEKQMRDLKNLIFQC